MTTYNCEITELERKALEAQGDEFPSDRLTAVLQWAVANCGLELLGTVFGARARRILLNHGLDYTDEGGDYDSPLIGHCPRTDDILALLYQGLEALKIGNINWQ